MESSNVFKFVKWKEGEYCFEMAFTRTFYGNQDAKTEIKFSHQDSLARSHCIMTKVEMGKDIQLKIWTNFAIFQSKLLYGLMNQPVCKLQAWKSDLFNLPYTNGKKFFRPNGNIFSIFCFSPKSRINLAKTRQCDFKNPHHPA